MESSWIMTPEERDRWSELVLDQTEFSNRENRLDERFHQFLDNADYPPEQLMDMFHDLPSCYARFLILDIIREKHRDYFDEHIMEKKT